jgi:hypothetical protein
MKLMPLSAAAARQERTDRLRRSRAASLALRSAFPEIQQLRLELQFEGASANSPASQSHVLHPPARAFFTFPCPFADCDGEFDLSGAVNAALLDRSDQAEGVLECSGVRICKHGEKQACLLRLVYSVTATYQQDR